jgi:hypothetical protein
MLTVSAGQSPGFRVGTSSDSASSNVNVPSCLAVHNLVTSKLSSYYTIAALDTNFNLERPISDLLLAQMLATKLPLGIGETSADDRYVRTSYELGHLHGPVILQ